MSPRLQKAKVFLSPDLIAALDVEAKRRGVGRSELHRQILAAWFDPDGPLQPGGALGRRLDRLTRQLDRIETEVRIGVETQGLFVRSWFTATPPLADASREQAEARGRARFAELIAIVGRRLAEGRSLRQEMQGRTAGPT